MFHSHLTLAHHYWKHHVLPGDIVIDATCGNGQDTLVLSELCLTPHSGEVHAMDINRKAIALSKQWLQSHLPPSLMNRVNFYDMCHSTFPMEIVPGTVSLIAYNLGYLPGGGDKSKTTKVETTLRSLSCALHFLKKGGLISITCYPGHSEGEKEEAEILKMVRMLDPRWRCCYHQWLNKMKAPSLLLIQEH